MDTKFRISKIRFQGGLDPTIIIWIIFLNPLLPGVPLLQDHLLFDIVLLAFYIQTVVMVCFLKMIRVCIIAWDF